MDLFTRFLTLGSSLEIFAFGLFDFISVLYSISLQYREPESSSKPWVFWSKNEEGSQNNSSCSADHGIHDKIKLALSNIRYGVRGYFAQFWAPVTIGGRRLLSTSGQPFAVGKLDEECANYRLHSTRYKYNIDDVNNGGDDDPMIKSGEPTSAFLNCRTSFRKLHEEFLQVSSDENEKTLKYSVMVPICLPSQTNCIGVLEFTFPEASCQLGDLLLDIVKAVKDAGLDVFYVQHLIPYKTTKGLQVTKDEIEEALKVVCETHELDLAQVWIAYEDKYNVPFSYSLKDTQTTQLFAIKLTGHLRAVTKDPLDAFERYFEFGDVTPRAIGNEFSLVTLQDYESRYTSNFYIVIGEFRKYPTSWYNQKSALAICLRSNDTNDFNYTFEFIWTKQSNDAILLEAILSTLKMCLPRFKFASGVELGDEVDLRNEDNKSMKFQIFSGKRSMVADYMVSSKGMCKTTPIVLPQELIEKQVGKKMKNAIEILDELGDDLDVHNEVDETKKVKIFQRKRSMVMDDKVPSKQTCKTDLIELPQEVIEKQFGKTMKDAAKNLKVSLSTLKRKVKALGMTEWQGPNFVKRNKNDSSIIQINANIEDNGAIEDTSTVSLNKTIMTLKVEYANDMIKFRLPISKATFATVEEKIGMKLKLSDRTYKLKYLDEDKDWISLTSDEEMRDCINSSRKSDRIIVRMCVLLVQ